MRLSAEKINETSPYWVIQLDEMMLRFRTDFGVIYNVGFYEDTFFFIDDAYHFYISNANKKPSPNDTKVLATVIAVIEEFFRLSTKFVFNCYPQKSPLHSFNSLNS